jgi:hypothetical protein
VGEEEGEGFSGILGHSEALSFCFNCVQGMLYRQKLLLFDRLKILLEKVFQFFELLQHFRPFAF